MIAPSYTYKAEELYKQKDWLEKQYYDNNLSLYKIASLVGVSAMTIRKWMKFHELQRRSISESNFREKNGNFIYGKHTDYEYMKSMCANGESLRSMARICKVSMRTIARWLEIHKLKTLRVRKRKPKKIYLCDCGRGRSRSAKKCSHCHISLMKENPPTKGRKRPIQERLNLSQKMKERRSSPEYCDPMKNPDSVKKIRLATLKRLESRTGRLVPGYNPDSIKIIEDYGKENGYNFVHAENGGEFKIEELGYWVDAYDKDKNVVLEIDEKHHFLPNGELKEKDKQRQYEIESHLNCTFIRIKI